MERWPLLSSCAQRALIFALRLAPLHIHSALAVCTKSLHIVPRPPENLPIFRDTASTLHQEQVPRKVSKTSRTGTGLTGRWLVLGWLAVVSGFHVPENNDARQSDVCAAPSCVLVQTDAGVELAHGSPLMSHESTITGEVDGAHERRQLASGSSCNGWCVSSQTSPTPHTAFGLP